MTQLIVLISQHNSPDWQIFCRLKPQKVLVLWTENFERIRDSFCNLLPKTVECCPNPEAFKGYGGEIDAIKKFLGAQCSKSDPVTLSCVGGTKVMLLEVMSALNEILDGQFTMEYRPEKSQSTQSLCWTHNDLHQITYQDLLPLEVKDHIQLYVRDYKLGDPFSPMLGERWPVLQEIEQAWAGEDWSDKILALERKDDVHCGLSLKSISAMRQWGIKDIKKFNRGGWLELLCLLEVQRQCFSKNADLASKSIATTLHIDNKSKITNECDVVYTLDGRLTIVECKTGFSETSAVKEFNSWLYKLDSVSSSLGKVFMAFRFGKGLQRQLAQPGQMSAVQQICERAKSKNVRLLCSEQEYGKKVVGRLEWDEYEFNPQHDLIATVRLKKPLKKNDQLVEVQLEFCMPSADWREWTLRTDQDLNEVKILLGDEEGELLNGHVALHQQTGSSKNETMPHTYHFHDSAKCLIIDGYKYFLPTFLLALLEQKVQPAAMVLNAFPIFLATRGCTIRPISLAEFKKFKGRLISCWGHSNTLPSVESFTGLNLKPDTERPSIELGPHHWPSYHGVEVQICFVFSAQRDNNLRPAIGTEFSSAEIIGWDILQVSYI